MKPGMNCRFVLLRGPWVVATFLLLCLTGVQVPCRAQLVVGAINGTVLDSSGAAVGDAEVKAHNVGTGLELKVHSNPAGYVEGFADQFKILSGKLKLKADKTRQVSPRSFEADFSIKSN